MDYFKQYSSNTSAAGGSQSVVISDNREQIGRIFYRVDVGGTFRWSLLYTNIVDSTFGSGDDCHAAYVVDSWHIHGCRIGRCSALDFQALPVDGAGCTLCKMDGTDLALTDWAEVTFQGKTEKDVMPGEYFTTDPVKLTLAKDEYLCVELRFSGFEIPVHEESILPCFVAENGVWRHNRHQPFPAMVGCDRPVKGRIGFIGDSITQGCGTVINRYEHWSAVVSRMLDPGYAYWDLGLGYARAQDAALDSSWLFKAKQNDIVVVCFGVNDVLHVNRFGCPEEIISSLQYITAALKKAGCRVLLQGVPPFDYTGETLTKWLAINEYLRAHALEFADAFFDPTPVLCVSPDRPQVTAHGSHPDGVGCALWAEALRPVLADMIADSERTKA